MHRIKIRQEPSDGTVPTFWWWRCPIHGSKGWHPTHPDALAAALTHAANAHPFETPC